MLEDLGLMEIGDGNLAAATSYFGEARTCYSNRDDILRVVIEEADAWSKLKKPKRGIDLLRSTLRVASDAPAAPLLRNLEQELRGISTTPTPRPTPRSPLIGHLPNKEFPSVRFGSFQADRGNPSKADGSHCFLSVTFAQ
jgi:hypothetical protein